MTERKAIGSIEVKDAEEGKVRAVVATLGVRDKDGDLIEPGAFGTQPVRVSAFNHGSWQGALPVGKGTVTESGDRAVADLQFFMETSHGQETFRTIKGLGDLGEWSFGFDIIQESTPDDEQQQRGIVRVLEGLKVHEVSPVLLGAGIATETVSAKCEECEAKGEGEKQDGFEIQTLIFTKEQWDSLDDVTIWAEEHDFDAGSVDETEDSWRLRQRDPDDFERLRTICINPGDANADDPECRVQAVGGPVGEESSREEGVERELVEQAAREVGRAELLRTQGWS